MPLNTTITPVAPGRRRHGTLSFVVTVSAFGVLALLAPLGAAEEPLGRVGALLAVGGGLQVLHGIRRADAAALRRAVAGGVISMLMGLLVLVTPAGAVSSFALLLAATFAVDGIGYLWAARQFAGRQQRLALFAAVADFATAVALLVLRGPAGVWVIAVVAALRLFGIAWAMAVTPVHTADNAAGSVLDELGLDDRPDAADLLARITLEERARAASDRRWTIAFLITLFAIHSARLESDRTLVGYLAPAIAVVGDAALALLFAFTVLAPLAVSRRTATQWLERRVWRWYLAPERGGGLRARAAGIWLRYRLRLAVQMREARFSLSAALWQNLAAGIPIAAIVAATVPVWGMSWYLRHRELGGRHLELVGRGAHRHLARGDGPGGPGGDRRATAPFAVTAAGASTAGDFSLHRDRRHRRRRRLAARPARPVADRRRRRRCELRRDLVGRRVSRPAR